MAEAQPSVWRGVRGHKPAAELLWAGDGCRALSAPAAATQNTSLTPRQATPAGMTGKCRYVLGNWETGDAATRVCTSPVPSSR